MHVSLLKNIFMHFNIHVIDMTTKLVHNMVLIIGIMTFLHCLNPRALPALTNPAQTCPHRLSSPCPQLCLY